MGPASTPPSSLAGGSTPFWRSFWFTTAGCVVLAAGGVGVLAALGQGRGAWMLGGTQALCLVLSVLVAPPMREALRREPGWRLALSWALSAGFIAAVVALYWAGRAFWAEALIAGVSVLYLISAGLFLFFPALASEDGAPGDGPGDPR